MSSAQPKTPLKYLLMAFLSFLKNKLDSLRQITVKNKTLFSLSVMLHNVVQNKDHLRQKPCSIVLGILQSFLPFLKAKDISNYLK